MNLKVMSFLGTGDINLLNVSSQEYNDPYTLVLNLKEVEPLPLATILPAIQGSALIALEGGRYFYRHLGTSMEVSSVVAWWLLYI